VTDSPSIYNIEPTKLYNNPIRLIDTAGFGDNRDEWYDEKITKDIQKLFESSEIENLNAICLIFRASETRAHDRAKKVITLYDRKGTNEGEGSLLMKFMKIFI
jgi:predicted GTPase